MNPGPAPRTAEDARGRSRLLIGGAFGVTGALIGIVLPVGVLLANLYAPSSAIATGAALVEVLAVLLAAGLVLLLVSFFAYRSAFARFRKVDRRFWVASALCLVGSLGLLVLLGAAIVVGGSSASVAQCVQGSPSHALSCLDSGSSGEFLGANLVVLGFWLAWVGSFGIVVGLALEGDRARRRTLTAAATVYAVTLLLIVGPFTALFLSYPGAADLLVGVPVLAVVAPSLVLSGTRPR